MAMHMMEEKLRQLQLQHEMKLQTEKVTVLKLCHVFFISTHILSYKYGE